MAKHKRKPSAAQRDKYNIDLAKKLKASGVLSKQTKLHGGKFISRDVLKKVRELETIARLNYGAVKVSKDLAMKAKAQNYMVIGGNKIVGPKTQAFRKRLEENIIAGLRPVKGGFMEEVVLPHSIFDLRTLSEGLDNYLDNLKLPNEYFAFKYKGGISTRAFPNAQALKEYLFHYKNIDLALSTRPEDIQEEFENVSIFRLHPNDYERVIPGGEARKRESNRRRAERKRQRLSRARDEMSIRQRERLQEIERERHYRKMQKLEANPYEKEKYLAKKREAMARLRATKNRGKK